MALIDTFLKLMLEKRAERLVLVADAVPYLLKEGESIELSMPSLRADILQRMAGEITGTELSGEVRREGSFKAADDTEFGYHIQASGPDCRIEVHALGAPRPRENSKADDLLEGALAGLKKTPASSSPSLATSPSNGPDLLATIDQAATADTSDIFLSSGKPPRVRRRGLISGLDAPAPDAAQILQLIPDDAARQEFERAGHVDFAAIPLRSTSSCASSKWTH